MPAAEVDAMLAAGPARRHYNPDLAGVLRLLAELDPAPRWPGSRSASRASAWSCAGPDRCQRQVSVPGNGAVVRERLRAARGFVLDLDGTLVLTDRANSSYTPLPGALPLTRWLTSRGVPFVLLTNGTAKTPQAYARALAEAGFGVPEAAVLTPAVSAAELFARRGHRRVMVLGTEGLGGPLRSARRRSGAACPGRAADAVLAGWYREFSMDALEAACDAVWQGARLYSCSQSVFFATAEGLGRWARPGRSRR